MNYQPFPEHYWTQIQKNIDTLKSSGQKQIAAFDADGTLWDADLGENFFQYQIQEERLANRLRIIAMGLPPLKIELNNYGSFPSHTIYIKITSKVPIQTLVKTIRTEAQRLMKLNDENKPHFILEPHLNIAAKLKPWQYEKGWLEFSNLHFSGRFMADAMLLLRRPVGELKFQVADRFEFQNLPVATTQGELF